MIKVFTLVKDEENIINDWLLYHTHLFGCNNIYVIDHQSTDSTVNILKEWHQKGVNTLQTSAPFSRKSSIISSLINKHCNDDFAIPLDVDEFITLKYEDGITACKDSIIAYFNNLEKDAHRYKFNQLDVIPSTDDIDSLIELHEFKTKWYDEWSLLAKTFYHSDYFINTDQGNHKGCVKGLGKDYVTDLTLIHYDVMSYEHFVSKMTRGAHAYGHHLSRTPVTGNGIHYHRRYWAIKDGHGKEQMLKEFGTKGNFTSDSLAKELKILREYHDSNSN